MQWGNTDQLDRMMAELSALNVKYLQQLAEDLTDSAYEDLKLKVESVILEKIMLK